MTSALIRALAVTAACLSPAVASGQRAPEPVLYEPGMDDLGSWNAVVVLQDPLGRRVTMGGVEINTLGCDGQCVETRVDGGLLPYRALGPAAGGPPAAGGTPASWDASLTPLWGYSRTGLPMPRRSTIERRPDGTRVLTVYGRRPDGADTLLLRAVYTRRP